MASILLKFFGSRLGISTLAIGLGLLFAGIQQLRINAYKADVKILKSDKQALNLIIEFKKAEAIDLKMAINNQNDQIQNLKTTALANAQERAEQVLALKFKHMQNFKSLNQGEGPEDLNLWLKKTLR